MKISFAKIFKSHAKTVPAIVKSELFNHFPEAINIDWDSKQELWEAVFYVNDVEHIAQISETGVLKEYKRNLWPNELPGQIAAESNKCGEIMNGIVIFKEDGQFFEVIVRDTKLNRTLLLFNQEAVLLSSIKL
jgi:hypothetical protein